MGHGQFFEATPAYGRDYKNQKDVLRDWHGDKDFQIHMGGRSTYTNKADIVNMNQGHRLILRYGNGMKTMMLHGDMKPPSWLQKEQAEASPNQGVKGKWSGYGMSPEKFVEQELGGG